MLIINEMNEFLSLIDEDTLEKIENANEFVIRAKSGYLLLSILLKDQSHVFLYEGEKDAYIWCENKEFKELASKIDENTGKEEIFEFFVDLTANDVQYLENLEDEVVSLEDDLFKRFELNNNRSRMIYEMRKKVWANKRYYEKMELLTDELMLQDPYFTFIDKKFDKLFNAVLRIQEYLEQVRQAYEAQIDIEQNNIMRFFTVITSVFMPLTLIVGWYGMNLIMPEFHWIYGYPFVIILSILIVAITFWVFKRKKWL